jgi:SAM-dependent methyltransferase
VVAAHAVEITWSREFLGGQTAARLSVGDQSSPQFVFYGTESAGSDVAQFVIPVEVLCGFFFVVLALTLVGPGQELGRALNRVPNRILAYSVNIFGSLVGIVLFALCSWLELPPFYWFAPIALGLGYFAFRRPSLAAGEGAGPAERPATRNLMGWVLLALVVLLASLRSGTHVFGGQVREYLWSPYYRLNYYPGPRCVTANLICHQAMIDADTPQVGYCLPYTLRRDAGYAPPENVLIIGAGSGNDVSEALRWGAKHVDAVEIDPVINRLGREHHPAHPYQDPRVTVHLDDGRRFLQSSDTQYDLIMYALVDSLVLQSSYSNIRLESYLYTQQAYEAVRRRLKPGGVFFMSNYFRQGWIVKRLEQGLAGAFGEQPLVFTMPYQEVVDPQQQAGGYTVLVAGDIARLRQAFSAADGRQREYWLRNAGALAVNSPSGFAQQPTDAERDRWLRAPLANRDEEPWQRFGPARVLAPEGDLPLATDDWPFLYLRRPMIPDVSLRGLAVMGGLALVLLLVLRPRSQEGGRRRSFSGAMFFLGAGFMLIETKAVVHMALLFGGTWMVNSVVFFAVLIMILAANLVVLRWQPRRLWPFYAGLLAALALNALVPLDFFLGRDRVVQVVGSCALVFAPVLFAGVIFAVLFSRSREPDRDLGANIAGAMVGGLAEYASMLVGFQYLMVLAIGFYALSALGAGRPSAPVEAEVKRIEEPVAV